MIVLLLMITVLSFMIIQLPPGSFVEAYLERLKTQGFFLDETQVEFYTRLYGLDRSLVSQYFIWMKNMLFHGSMGRSFQYNQPVTKLIAERVPMTMFISLLAILFQWVVAIPIGIYSAIRQYSIADYFFTFVGFIGLALPNFLFALVLMYVVYARTGWAITALFSSEFMDAPWSFARLIDLLKNIWLPMVVIGTAGSAALIRILRGSLLDELHKHYVVTARSKGLKEMRLTMKYPLRVALNPFISTLGWILPAVVGGEVVVSQVLNLKTVGPILLGAVRSEDMYLAGGIILVLSSLTVVGTLISDIMLAWIDPRIRFDKEN